MKPILSADGSVETGFGLVMTAYGASHVLFPDRNDPVFSAVMFGVGIILAVCGIALRRQDAKKLEKD